MEFIKNWISETQIDFVGKRHIAGISSIVLVLASWIVFVMVGPNWGIDFTGGTEIQLKFNEEVDISDVRSAIENLGLAGDAVQEVGSPENYEFTVRIQDATFGSEDLKAEVEGRFREAYGEDWIQETQFGAEIGARLTITYGGKEITPQKATKVLEGLSGVVVQYGNDPNQLVVKLPGLASQIQKKIEAAMEGRSFEVMSIDAVGPKVGGELRRQGFVSILATLLLVLIYVGFRFDIGFAPGAILALIHDVSVTMGVFVLMQLEFNLPMIGALLTIVGYSLNDTIVIYDRIRENRDRYRRKETEALINVSINETLARTIATSFTTGVAMLMFVLLGGSVIQNFAFAMLLGVIFGTYSTIFVASPMILIMEDVKPYLSRFVALPVADGDQEDGEESPQIGPPVSRGGSS